MKFCNKKKTKDLTADVVLVAAAAGAVAAGCVIAAYEALKSEKGQAAIAKTKAATVAAQAQAEIGFAFELQEGEPATLSVEIDPSI